MKLSLLHPLALSLLLLLPPVFWLGLRSRRLPVDRRRRATVLRAFIFGLLVLGLARPQLSWPAGQRATSVLVDASGSVPADERARAERFTAEAAEISREDRQLAVVVFGAEARVDRAPRAGEMAPIRSAVDAGATDLAAALRLGAGILPAGRSARLALLSDGRANRGDLTREAQILAARGIPVDILPLVAGVSGEEAWIARFEAPAGARQGQRIELALEIRATAAGPAHLQVLRDGVLVEDLDLDLQPGLRRLTIDDRADAPGPRRYVALLEPERDTRSENNSGAAITLVAGPPRLLIVAEEPARARALADALRAVGQEAELASPEDVPATTLGLAAFDSFLLVDLPAASLPPSTQDAMVTAVRDLGRGLVMIGGRKGFGAGGWRGTPIETVMPVEMLVEADERRPDIALAFLIDRSSSMGEPADPGLRGGPSKLDLAKEAVLQAGGLLREEDRMGVLAFDIAAHPTWPLQAASDPVGFEQAVLGIQAEGGTSLTAGLSPASRALSESGASRKHVILLSDGWTDEGGLEAARRETLRLAASGISLSIVAVGEASAPALAELALLGGGRYYPARDPSEVPRIFVEETQLALGTFIVEESFQPRAVDPSPILKGLELDKLPALTGYDAVTERTSASLALRSHLEDPILAHWQYGLGRSVAWTSDLDGLWAGAWLDWDLFSRFVSQLVDWSLPPPETDGLEITVALDGPRAELTVDLTGEPAAGVEGLDMRMLAPDGEVVDLALERVATDRFEGSADLSSEGAWLLRATGRDAAGLALVARTAGFVLPFGAEYADASSLPTDPRLFELAETTGGRVLQDPADVFAPVPGASSSREAWPWLLTLAALLWPLDVALRKLGPGLVTRRDILATRARVG